MTAKGPQWADKDLRVTQIQRRPDFQLRAGGVQRGHVATLRRVLDDRRPLDPVKVAQVGAALYLVDGYHRLAAHELAGRETIAARVARMSLPQAKEEAKLANTKHGLRLTNADKRRIFQAHVDAGLHRDAAGKLKSRRAIAADLNHIVSPGFVRARLLEMDLGDELDEVDPVGTWTGREEADEAELEAERLDDAEDLLRRFGDLFPSLGDDDKPGLLTAARGLLDALERGDMPELVLPMDERLGI